MKGGFISGKILRGPGQRAPGGRSGAALDAVGRDGAVFRGIEEEMPGLRAEMREVDGGHAVGCRKAKDLARAHGGKRLAGAQDGEGAEEPLAIQRDVMVACHGVA